MIEPTLDRLERQPQRLVLDRAFDSDKFRDRIAARGTDPIVPYRKRAVIMKYNDGRKMRRYKRRWKVKRLFAWLNNYRRLVVRWDHNPEIYRAFLLVAFIMILARQL